MIAGRDRARELRDGGRPRSGADLPAPCLLPSEIVARRRCHVSATACEWRERLRAASACLVHRVRRQAAHQRRGRSARRRGQGGGLCVTRAPPPSTWRARPSRRSPGRPAAVHRACGSSSIPPPISCRGGHRRERRGGQLRRRGGCRGAAARPGDARRADPSWRGTVLQCVSLAAVVARADHPGAARSSAARRGRSHESAGHRRDRIRRRGGRSGAAGEGWQVRALVRARVGSPQPRNARRRAGRGRSDRRALRSSGRSPAARPLFHVAADYRLWAPRAAASCTAPTSRAPRHSSSRGARGGRAAHRLHQQRRHGRNAGRWRRPAARTTPVALADMIGHYKRSKFLAEEVAREAAARGVAGRDRQSLDADRAGRRQADAHRVRSCSMPPAVACRPTSIPDSTSCMSMTSPRAICWRSSAGVSVSATFSAART